MSSNSLATVRADRSGGPLGGRADRLVLRSEVGRRRSSSIRGNGASARATVCVGIARGRAVASGHPVSDETRSTSARATLITPGRRGVSNTKGKVEMDTKQGFLVLADISGFTALVTATELE